MRIALISDIHANLVALDAVLADARSVGVDAFWVLGDLIAIGPEPVAVLDRLAALEHATFVRGNTDRYVVTGEGPPPSLEDALADPSLVPLYARVTASFAWTRGFITAHGWYDWLAKLPLDARLVLPDGSRLLGVHAAPGTDDGEGLHPGQSAVTLAQRIAGCDADIVCTGHTHQPFRRRVGDVEVVNLGSVGNPRAPDLRASYVVLHASPRSTRIGHRRVSYDHATFMRDVQRTRHPEAEFILDFQRGKMVGRSPHPDHASVEPA